MFDLISIGDSVIDTFIPIEDATAKVIDGEPMLCLRFGDKIPVGSAISLVAGNAANNAVGSSRLKLKTAIYTNIGNDLDGKKIKEKFKEERVNTRYVVENSNLPSNHHIVLDFKGERTILIYHQPWEFNLPDLDQAKWIYFTSLAPSFVKSNLISQLISYLERTGTRLLYNPGTFQIKFGIKKSPRLLSLTQALIMNKEEAKLVLGHKEGDNIPLKKLLKGLTELGPKMAVITDGKKGSFGFDGRKYYQLNIFPAQFVEATGAGDGFATGVLAALFHGKDLPEAMRWGAANGAAVVEEIGSQKGLLTYDKMQGKLRENSKIIAKEI